MAIAPALNILSYERLGLQGWEKNWTTDEELGLLSENSIEDDP